LRHRFRSYQHARTKNVQVLCQFFSGQIGAKFAEALPTLDRRRQQTDYALVLLAQQLRHLLIVRPQLDRQIQCHTTPLH
jgi:hypothetical protein